MDILDPFRGRWRAAIMERRAKGDLDGPWPLHSLLLVPTLRLIDLELYDQEAICAWRIDNSSAPDFAGLKEPRESALV